MHFSGESIELMNIKLYERKEEKYIPIYPDDFRFFGYSFRLWECACVCVCISIKFDCFGSFYIYYLITPFFQITGCNMQACIFNLYTIYFMLIVNVAHRCRSNEAGRKQISVDSKFYLNICEMLPKFQWKS